LFYTINFSEGRMYLLFNSLNYNFISFAITVNILIDVKCELYTSYLHMSQLVNTQFEITKKLREYLNGHHEHAKTNSL
jgi:hypothetical protein